MKTKIILPLLLCFVATIYAQKKEIKKASSLVTEKNYTEALTLLNQVENTYTNEGEKWQSMYLITKGKALLANKQGTSFENLKSAAQTFIEAIDLGVDKKTAMAGLEEVRVALVENAIQDQKNGKNVVAANKLYESYQLGKQDTLYLYYAASSAVNAKEYDMALKYYNELLDLNYNGASVTYQATNKETNQLENFGNKTLRDASVKIGTHIKPVDKKNPSKRGEIAKNVSLIYIEQNKPEKALASIKRAKEENPDDTGLMQAEADLYYNMDNIKKYNEIMSSIAEKNPNDPIVFYNLGVSAEKLNDLEKARKYYEKAIELDPKMSNGYNNIASIILSEDRVITEEMNSLGMSAADSKKYDKLKAKKIEVIKNAIPYLTKAIELDPTNLDAMKYLKNIYYQTKNEGKVKEIDNLIKQAQGN